MPSVCVYVCAHEPVGNPVNHYCVSSMCARICVCVFHVSQEACPCLQYYCVNQR